MLMEEQPQNIRSIFVTLLVSKFERLSEVKEEQPENIRYISVTLLVLKFPKKLRFNFVRLFESDELLNSNLNLW